MLINKGQMVTFVEGGGEIDLGSSLIGGTQPLTQASSMVRRYYEIHGNEYMNIEMLNQSLDVVDKEIGYIFGNEESFLNRFCKSDWTDLTEVSFTRHDLKISYILYSGQHVCDRVVLEDYLEWRGEV